jgi:hypothetical protein
MLIKHFTQKDLRDVGADVAKALRLHIDGQFTEE